MQGGEAVASDDDRVATPALVNRRTPALLAGLRRHQSKSIGRNGRLVDQADHHPGTIRADPLQSRLQRGQHAAIGVGIEPERPRHRQIQPGPGHHPSSGKIKTVQHCAQMLHESDRAPGQQRFW